MFLTQVTVTGGGGGRGRVCSYSSKHSRHWNLHEVSVHVARVLHYHGPLTYNSKRSDGLWAEVATNMGLLNTARNWQLLYTVHSASVTVLATKSKLDLIVTVNRSLNRKIIELTESIQNVFKLLEKVNELILSLVAPSQHWRQPRVTPNMINQMLAKYETDVSDLCQFEVLPSHPQPPNSLTALAQTRCLLSAWCWMRTSSSGTNTHNYTVVNTQWVQVISCQMPPQVLSLISSLKVRVPTY